MLAAARSSTLPPSPFSLPQALEQVGEELLRLAQTGPPTRDTALSLLAADTLITLACEVAAES